jgi:flagellar biosynthesis protein FliQ
MDTGTVVTIIGQAVVLIAKLAGPFLVATLVVGLTV